MLVAVDATSWDNRRGYGRFARNAIARLVERDGPAAYVLVSDAVTAARGDLPRAAEVLLVRASEAGRAGGGRPLADILRLSRATRKLRPDVVLFPSLYSWYPVPSLRNVVGVHDMIADEHPELTLPSPADRARWRLKRRAAVRGATRLFTVSETSRAAVAAGLGVPEEALAVVPEAPDPVFGPREPDVIAAVLAPLGLAAGEPFLLYAGGISPHKGLDTLLAAYASLTRRAGAPRLVLAGALEEETYLSAAAEVRRTIAESGLSEQVLLPGHVPDETLACLYAGATAFVSPSRSEGFGLPAVEAAACRCPVVLSDIPAHRESMGDAALTFPVGDAAALEAVLARVTADGSLRADLAERAAVRVSSLNWDAAADALWSVLEEAARAR